MSEVEKTVETFEDMEVLMAEEDILPSCVPPSFTLADVVGRNHVEGPGVSSNQNRIVREWADPGSLTPEEQWEQVKTAFMGAKSPQEIELIAHGLPLCDWLDYAIKMMPKAIQMRGQFQVQQLVAQLGPIQRKKQT